MEDHELGRLLRVIGPLGRDVLRRAMRAEQPERTMLASQLLREGRDVARDLADLVDLASMNPEIRRQLARVLGELEALGD